MNLTAEKIQLNWNEFMGNIDTYISSPRKEKLIEFSLYEVMRYRYQYYP